MKALVRDLVVYIVSLLFLVYVFWDRMISFEEALILVLMWPIYFIYTIKSESKNAQE